MEGGNRPELAVQVQGGGGCPLTFGKPKHDILPNSHTEIPRNVPFISLILVPDTFKYSLLLPATLHCLSPTYSYSYTLHLTGLHLTTALFITLFYFISLNYYNLTQMLRASHC